MTILLRPSCWGPRQNFWVFLRFFIFEAEYKHFYTRKVEKKHKITHLHPHFTMCMSRTRLQLKIIFFFKLPCLFQIFTLGCETECVTNLRDKTQIFTQTNRSWLRFYSELLCKIWWVEALVLLGLNLNKYINTHIQLQIGSIWPNGSDPFSQLAQILTNL